MNYIYVIQNENYEAIVATFSIVEALKLSRSNAKFSYREVPYLNSEEYTITAIAGPITAEYLPRKS